MKMKKKNLKPIDIDCHLKYRCPNNDCRNEHWITLKESKTKNFIVVCDCGSTFKVKTVKKFKLIYNCIEIKPAEGSEEDKNDKIPVELLDKCAKMMVGLGFTINESKTLLSNFYDTNKIDDPISLVKNTISNIGVTNNE
jgi:Tat protein secretion system quality control protein TatD with DNase activity